MGSLFFNTVAWMHVPKVIQFTENLLFFDVAARVAAEWGLTHAARQTAHMPAQVVNLQRGPEKWAEVNQEGFQGKRPGLECELLKQPRIKKWRNNKEKQYPSSKIKKKREKSKMARKTIKELSVFLPLINIYPRFPRCSWRTQLCPTAGPSPAATTRPHPKPPPARPEGIRPAVSALYAQGRVQPPQPAAAGYHCYCYYTCEPPPVTSPNSRKPNHSGGFGSLLN